MARDYGRKNGFTGTFYIEPKPMEPSKHQYDFDAATVIGFLRAHGLDKDFKLNIEANHATLAGHSFSHELQVAADAGLLGSIDANRGDAQNGWDTDQFPTDLYQATEAMMIVLEAGGLRRPAASTSTPRCDAIRPIPRTCSWLTSAAWTPSRAAWRSRRSCSTNRR